MPSFPRFRGLLLLAALPLLSGCNAVLLSPSGDIAVQQRNLIIISTGLMLLIIVPVIFLTFLFAWRYRASNRDAHYDPDWNHSTMLELLIWAAPLLIIIALGALTWVSTHQLDPYRPLARLSEGREVPPGTKPLVVEVVALDWKWLFLYPEQGVAAVNELAAPVDRPIQFKITSSTVMNSFFIPALAGQIYAMPGMQTTLHAVINHPGEYEGLSANYSGAGFSGMRFRFHGLDQQGFDKWIADARASGAALGRDTYLKLEQPSERNPVQRYASVAPGLFDAIVNRCVEPNRMCMKDAMAIDAGGGMGIPGARNIASLDQATRERLGLADAPPRKYVDVYKRQRLDRGLRRPQHAQAGARQRRAAGLCGARRQEGGYPARSGPHARRRGAAGALPGAARPIGTRLAPSSTALRAAQQVALVQQRVDDLGFVVEAAADGGRNRRARLAAKARLVVELDGDAARGAHLVVTGDDAHHDAQLRLHAALHRAQVFQAGDVLEPRHQALFLFLGQPQDARVGRRVGQQPVAVAHTGARGTFLTDGERKVHGTRIAGYPTILPRNLRPPRAEARPPSGRGAATARRGRSGIMRREEIRESLP